MGNQQYVTGLKDVTQTSDQVLVREATAQAIFVNSIFTSENARNELNLILKELERRHPDWHWADMRNGLIVVGMTELEAILSWGYPTKVNRSSYQDQWLYESRGYGTYSAQYLYFEKGLLTAFN